MITKPSRFARPPQPAGAAAPGRAYDGNGGSGRNGDARTGRGSGSGRARRCGCRAWRRDAGCDQRATSNPSRQPFQLSAPQVPHARLLRGQRAAGHSTAEKPSRNDVPGRPSGPGWPSAGSSRAPVPSPRTFGHVRPEVDRHAGHQPRQRHTHIGCRRVDLDALTADARGQPPGMVDDNGH
jgi:hypothetical protein